MPTIDHAEAIDKRLRWDFVVMGFTREIQLEFWCTGGLSVKVVDRLDIRLIAMTESGADSGYPSLSCVLFVVA